MASIIVGLPNSPPLVLFVKGAQQPLFGTLQNFKVPTVRDRIGIITKATGEGPESSVVKCVQDVWDKSEDRLALIGLGFAGVVTFWASINFITAIDKLPIIPSVLELVGILYSGWFTYRYLLFKPDREELSRAISKSISDILEQ